MGQPQDEPSAGRFSEIVAVFLKLGATAYGGPAIMGIMQAELQERRQWVSKERFLEGLSLVNMLPGAAATQLAIFLGHARGGGWGGLLAGLCFVLPAFAIMLALTLGYASYGATPLMSGALHGLGPVVLAVFVVALYRLGKTAVAGAAQWGMGLAAALAAALGALGIVQILALAGALGVLLFHSRARGALVLGALVALFALLHWLPATSAGLAPSLVAPGGAGEAPGLAAIGAFFLKVGAFSFGGGLTLIAFIQ